MLWLYDLFAVALIAFGIGIATYQELKRLYRQNRFLSQEHERLLNELDKTGNFLYPTEKWKYQ